MRSTPQLGAEPARNGGTVIPEKEQNIDNMRVCDEIEKKKKPGRCPALVRFDDDERISFSILAMFGLPFWFLCFVFPGLIMEWQ